MYNLRFNDINIPVGHYCRKFRKSKNISLEKMAMDTGVSTALLSAFENGSRSSVAALMYLFNNGMSADALCKYTEKYLDLMTAVDFEKEGVDE